MAKKAKERNFTRIPIAKIEAGPSQARTRQIDKEIDELAESMKKWGLIHPITVYQEDDKYFVLAGQRRLRAAKQLGWTQIDAEIVEKPVDSLVAKGLSFSETAIRTDLPDPDIAEVIILFHHKYGRLEPICRELGVPLPKGRKLLEKHVAYAMLPDKLKKLVDEDKVDLKKHALRAMRAATLPDGSVEEDKAVTLALGLKPLAPEQQKYLVTVAAEDPTAPAEDMLEKTKQPPPPPLVVHLPRADRVALNKVALIQGKTPEEWAATAIHETLSRAGLL